MNFYHNLITEKSWKLLVDLKRKYKFILIGGWAVFIYTRSLKSKDIDLVCEFGELEKIKKEFDVAKNNRLKKYEAKVEGIDIDIYLPFYSTLGLPAEDLKTFSQTLEGFTVVEKEVLAILKEKALKERANSLKGRKDLIDLIGLFQLSDFDWAGYGKIIGLYKLEEISDFAKKLVGKTSHIDELDLNTHKMAKFKKKILHLF